MHDKQFSTDTQLVNSAVIFTCCVQSTKQKKDILDDLTEYNYMLQAGVKIQALNDW